MNGSFGTTDIYFYKAKIVFLPTFSPFEKRKFGSLEKVLLSSKQRKI